MLPTIQQDSALWVRAGMAPHSKGLVEAVTCCLPGLAYCQVAWRTLAVQRPLQ
jgi:hypothetical protein